MSKFIFSLIFVSSFFTSNAQEKDPAVIKDAVESKSYIFRATMVFPQGMNSRTLTPGYDLIISGDTVTSYLPYFGRAYTAPVGKNDGGLKFTLVKPAYTMENDGKKYVIKIVPENKADVQELDLTVFENGRASLIVLSTNRQTISFDGHIEKGKQNKKKGF